MYSSVFKKTKLTQGLPIICYLELHNWHSGSKIISLQLNQIKSLLLSHHHSTSALLSEIIESVLQTVQKQFTFRQYILNRLIQKTMSRIDILSTHSVLFKTYLQLAIIILIIITRYAPYVHILHYAHIYTHSSMRKKVQQILRRPDTQCHGCALDVIQW